MEIKAYRNQYPSFADLAILSRLVYDSEMKMLENGVENSIKLIAIHVNDTEWFITTFPLSLSVIYSVGLPWSQNYFTIDGQRSKLVGWFGIGHEYIGKVI